MTNIAGLETNPSGLVWIGERNVTHVAPKDRDIAMVFQNYALYPHMSVYKNLSFGLRLRLNRNFDGGVIDRGLRKFFQPQRAAATAQLRAGIDNKVRQAALRLGIEHLLDREPHELSGGERQRDALGRAVVRNPAAFLFDEPLSNLDAKLRQQTGKTEFVLRVGCNSAGDLSHPDATGCLVCSGMAVGAGRGNGFSGRACPHLLGGWGD